MKFHLCIKTITLLMLSGSLVACAGGNSKKEAPATTSQAQKYKQQKATSLLGASIPSSNNQCVDNFNFLKGQQSQDYALYSNEYSVIGNGYRFLNENKNIMDEGARNIYQMNLDMKLNTLCTKVQYSGYQLIRNKIQKLSSI